MARRSTIILILCLVLLLHSLFGQSTTSGPPHESLWSQMTAAIQAASKSAALPQGGGIIDVQSYGARGDGVTDDTYAIQTALDALPAAGGVVMLMPGTHRITSALRIGSNRQLVGYGMYATTLEVAGNTEAIVTDTRAYGWRLKDFALQVPSEAHADTTTSAILVGTGNAQWEIDSIIVRSPGRYDFQDGLTITSAWTATVNRFRTENVRRYALYMTGGQAILFDNCDFSGLGLTACAYVAGNANTFNTCKFQGHRVGLELRGAANSFICPWFENDYNVPDVWCVHMDGDAHENTFLNGSYAAGGRLSGGYFKLAGSATYNTIWNPLLSETTGDLVRLEGSAQYNTFSGGNVPWSEVILQESRGNYYSIHSASRTERIARWWYDAPAVEFDLGQAECGLKLKTGVTSVPTDPPPGLYVTGGGGRKPFDVWGNLLIKPRNAPGYGVEVWTGATPAQRVKIDESAATFAVPIAPASLADTDAPNNSIYYSTTQGKLVYKDAKGVVNGMY